MKVFPKFLRSNMYFSSKYKYCSHTFCSVTVTVQNVGARKLVRTFA